MRSTPVHRHLPALLALALAVPAAGEFYNDHELAPHNYGTRPLADPMTRLLDRAKAGEITLDEPAGRPLVERLLRELGIRKETQVLVFSKTSLQKRAVSPKNPRAIYFNDEVYLGWMPGGRIEIASFDPDLGPIFYFQRPLDDPKAPLFARNSSCLGCHAGDDARFIPANLGLSVYPDALGRSRQRAPGHRTSNHTLPWEHRWGGWYVTGRHGDIRHMGNAIASREGNGVRIDREKFANLENLDAFFPPGRFPAPGSDVGALLVFDHQITMHNLIVEGTYRARQALFDSKLANDETDRAKLGKESAKLVKQAVRMIVDGLLFRDEAPLGKGVVADPAFVEAFRADRRACGAGRSLKDFRLEDRIFEHRCSYMIHSPAFDGLPPILKAAVYKRLRRVLAADTPVERYAYLGTGERKAIMEILRATRKDLPEGW
ncbi:MAG: hypothetical protein HKN82_02790 [Akkermansiaceae bacterium]|nr:hypothetical protein [Akkermansiaceae bacterium]